MHATNNKQGTKNDYQMTMNDSDLSRTESREANDNE